MRLIITIALFQLILSNCFGQQIDSSANRDLQLIESKPDIASARDYNYCIDLTHSNYILIINGKKYVAVNEKALAKLIKNKKRTITNHPLSIIYDSVTTPGKMVTTLDILTAENIKRYKFASTDGKSAIRAQRIKKENTFSKDINLSDSTILIITIKDTCLDISLLKNSLSCKKLDDVEAFISDNKKHIDPYKVVVIGSKDLVYKDVQPVISLLTKHEYFNFKLLPKD
ncbi:MAG: hypothetical protein IT249_16675 [Chitinophagaceae bacterium]|nr:hypothetical protein [Chitinophagaceae bacterium]